MQWQKQGCIFVPPGQPEWMSSHAAVPVALHLAGARYRIYFTTRDRANRSHVGFFEIDLRRPTEILDLSSRPVLEPGRPGMFDDSGAMASCIVRHGDVMYLYYVGWNRSVTVPFRNALGLAVSHDGGRQFRRFAEGPILDRSIHDPSFVASAAVLVEGGQWRMWYQSCVGWNPAPNGLQHKYHLKYAESDDGVEWYRDGRVAIDFRDDLEYAIAQPSVLAGPEGYTMWYSHRGPSYRIGLARSADGLAWRRDDAAAGIDVSEAGWDAEMIEYPCVFQHEGACYLLYNGNQYGKTGIGLAVGVE